MKYVRVRRNLVVTLTLPDSRCRSRVRKGESKIYIMNKVFLFSEVYLLRREGRATGELPPRWLIYLGTFKSVNETSLLYWNNLHDLIILWNTEVFFKCNSGIIFLTILCTIFNSSWSAAPQITMCRRMLGSNLGLFRRWQCQSNTLATRLHLIFTRLDFICTRLDLTFKCIFQNSKTLFEIFSGLIILVWRWLFF